MTNETIVMKIPEVKKMTPLSYWSELTEWEMKSWLGSERSDPNLNGLLTEASYNLTLNIELHDEPEML